MARSAELPKGSSRFVALASVCLVVAALYFAREVLVPLALATLAAFLLAPLVTRLERFGLGRAPATLIVVLFALGIVGGLGYIVGKQFLTVLEELPGYRVNIKEKIATFSKSSNPFKRATTGIEQVVKEAAGNPASQPATHPGAATAPAADGGSVTESISREFSHQSPAGLVTPPLPPQLTPDKPVPPGGHYTKDDPLPVSVIPPRSTAIETLSTYASRFLDPLATTGLVIIFMIFILLTREDLRDRMIRLIGHGRLNVTTQALDEAGSRISRYLVAQSLVNSAYGVATSAGLWVIGRVIGHQPFPNVLLWGLICAVMRFVPYIGIWLAMALPVAVSFAVYPGNGVFVGTVGMFVAYEVVVSQFVEPYLYGSSTGMSAIAVLVAAVFWTWLWGSIGLLLSTPLTVCLVVMGKYVPQLAFLDILLGDEPVLEPKVRLYQRLIAMDEEEATEVVREYRKDHTLEQVYDDVLIPGLLLAERDRYHGRLDDQRHKFIRQAMSDIVEEMGDEERGIEMREAAAATVDRAKDQAPTGASVSVTDALKADRSRQRLPKECTVNVLCLPARDETDEVVALMLAQLLELRGYCSTPVAVAALASEMVQMVEEKKADIVAVSAMPPAAVAHARYLCKRLHAKFPDVKMLVGLWQTRGDLEQARKRMTCADSVHAVRTLAEAQHEIDQLTQPILITSGSGV